MSGPSHYSSLIEIVGFSQDAIYTLKTMELLKGF